MRIIAGKYKGLHLFFQKETWQRPTQDKVKESLFNILQNDIEGASFLDLFCGTGGIGIEALSRNAKNVVFVDRNIEVAKKNLSLLKDADNYQIYKCDIQTFFKKNSEKFSIIFLDPPWENQELYQFSLKSIIENKILAPQGILICEHRKKFMVEQFFPSPPPKQYIYGDTVLSVFRP